jgi:hypothetical protein
MQENRVTILFGVGAAIFLFCVTFKPALGPTQRLIQKLPGALCVRLKQTKRATDHFHCN